MIKKMVNCMKYFCALVLSLFNPIFNPFRRGPHRKELKMGVNRSGYIMIFTLLIVGAVMMIVTYVGHRGSFYLPFSHMLFAREKAEMLAFGGIQVAIAQLSQVDKENQSSSAKATEN